MMYTFKAAPDEGFPGDIVLDPFNGTGATCFAAKQTGRRYIGIDLNPTYCKFAEDRLRKSGRNIPEIIIPRIKVKGALTGQARMKLPIKYICCTLTAIVSEYRLYNRLLTFKCGQIGSCSAPFETGCALLRDAEQGRIPEES